ncbi:MAG TPA: FecR domain-containing protein, partial [Chitinophaga sp.]|nr:FecR domain-containing protein [Chitinophaga sp.]
PRSVSLIIVEQSIDISYLLKGHIAGSLSDQEKLVLYTSLKDKEKLAQWNGLIAELYEQAVAETSYDPARYYTNDDLEGMIRYILHHAPEKPGAGNNSAPVHRIHFLKTSWFRYAAAVLILAIGITTAIVVSSDRQSQSSGTDNLSIAAADIAPGTNRAILTVGSKKIDLASNKTGISVGNAISYTDGSSIEGLTHSSQLTTHTLTTPRGGQYQAVLPDGSKVWLNAASSIKFPSKFTSATREVEITGEVYLEIAQNAKQPFYVHTGKTNIQVLGTSFNVEAYEDEKSVTTTLLQGAIQILKGKERLALKPGQQAITDPRIDFIKFIPEANIDEVTAWRAGLFNFNNAGVEAVLRQLERWYDINVVYRSTIPDIEFAGEMSRNTNLSGVLKILKDAGLNYQLEGKTLTIL